MLGIDYAEERKRRMKFNHFDKPNAMELAPIAEARNGRKKSKKNR